ncbi:PucR family transcriptional regulator [Streptomyces sp. SHP 1-2]|uniref:PucR family transcriptional regulator n=1 Tax=Streptomyces sp. SHP 1-2 TaxID=2769489 RepID=UPI002239058D|nr:helix-turn-helix domain-containing protein [Streptomyces sp. SHP 1-2]MCW5251396.1 helix-turn-helix domain-containing protein [Streptomyces sp. SHP 1-2]
MTGRPRVADLLHDPVLDGVRTVAGAAGTERTVRDVRWYDGDVDGIEGHLLLCGESDVTPLYRLDALVRRAQEAGAAALLVVAAPAQPLLSGVRLADRLRIPVLWLREDHPVRLVQELTARVRAPEQARARTVERLLRRLAARRTGRDILAGAGEVLAAPLSLVTAEGDVLLGDPVALDPALRLGQPVPQRADRVLVHPVLDPDAHRAAAWLACPYERAAESRLDTLAVGLAMTEPFVRSWLSAQRARTVRDSVFQSRMLSEILTGGDSVSRDVVQGAVSLGWRLQGWHVGLHLAAGDPGAPGVRDPLVEEFRAALARHGVPLAGAVNRGDGWALWTTTDTEPAPDDARATLRAVRRVIAALPRDRDLTAGIGRPHPGPGGLAETLTEARDAAELARSHDHRPAVEHSDELGVARLLATWQRSEATRAFADTSLAPLRDPAHTHLLATLRTYLESGGSVVLTAQALGVHRNTVTARLQQVRERLGIDLDDPSRRLALQVACRALGA